MGPDWMAAGVYAAAGALGGLLYWGSQQVIARLRIILRAR